VVVDTRSAKGKLDHVRLSQQHGSFAKEAAGYVGIGFGHVIATQYGTSCRTHALHVNEVFKRQGNPVQRAQEVSARHKRFRSLCLGSRPFVGKRYIGVYRRVKLLYALKKKLRQFNG
jgi:hypothetical protein